MATRTIKKMLGNLPVGVVDVVRLFVESVEEMEEIYNVQSTRYNLGNSAHQRCAGEDGGWSRVALISAFRRVVRAGVKAVADEEKTLPFGEVVRRSMEVRQSRRKSTLYDLRSYAGRMVRYGDWAGKPLRSIGTEECREMLQKLFGHSPWAYRKGRSVLHSLFAYGVRNGWCERNPVDAIEVPRVVERRIEPLGLEEIRRLMEACKGTDMEAAVTLMLWCGVRPAEVQRLTWEDVNTAEGVVYIPPQHSKTGGARLIPLRGHAANFPHRTSSIVDRTCRICPPNWAKRWRTLRHRAGFTRWQQDALRHTFASYHTARFCNPPQLQSEMGHRDSSLLRTRYVNLHGLTPASAKSFWTPRRNVGKYFVSTEFQRRWDSATETAGMH